MCKYFAIFSNKDWSKGELFAGFQLAANPEATKASNQKVKSVHGSRDNIFFHNADSIDEMRDEAVSFIGVLEQVQKEVRCCSCCHCCSIK